MVNWTIRGINMIAKNWEELELFVEKASPDELKCMMCPNCGAPIKVQRTSSNKTIRISCEACKKETIICGMPINK